MDEQHDHDRKIAEIEALLRDLNQSELTLEAPPASVWAGIEAAIDAPEPANVVRPAAWSRRLLAVAAAIVAVVVGAAVVTQLGGPTTHGTAELAYDAAAFDPLGADAAAEAIWLDDDNRELIEIDDASLPFDLGEDADLELWLIEVDDTGTIVDMVSLGDIHADGPRQFAVPDGYDPAVYSVVDISVEPHDGDPTHSGRSILRGQLNA